jgi:hypothetical protein
LEDISTIPTGTLIRELVRRYGVEYTVVGKLDNLEIAVRDGAAGLYRVGGIHTPRLGDCVVLLIDGRYGVSQKDIKARKDFLDSEKEKGVPVEVAARKWWYTEVEPRKAIIIGQEDDSKTGDTGTGKRYQDS